MDKKGIELSMNFLVIIILSIVMLTSGIIILRNMISGSTDIKTQLDQQTISQIENLLNQGSTVVIPFNSKPIKRGEAELFGVGIINIDKDNEKFRIDASLSKAIDDKNKDITDVDADSWLLYDSEFVTLDINGQYKTAIGINVPQDAPTGAYIYNIKVYKEDNTQYGSTKKIYVTVIG